MTDESLVDRCLRRMRETGVPEETLAGLSPEVMNYLVSLQQQAHHLQQALRDGAADQEDARQRLVRLRSRREGLRLLHAASHPQSGDGAAPDRDGESGMGSDVLPRLGHVSKRKVL